MPIIALIALLLLIGFLGILIACASFHESHNSVGGIVISVIIFLLILIGMLWSITAAISINTIEQGYFTIHNIDGVQIIYVNSRIFNVTKYLQQVFPEGTTIYVSNTEEKTAGIIWYSIDYHMTPFKDGKKLSKTKTISVDPLIK